MHALEPQFSWLPREFGGFVELTALGSEGRDATDMGGPDQQPTFPEPQLVSLQTKRCRTICFACTTPCMNARKKNCRGSPGAQGLPNQLTLNKSTRRYGRPVTLAGLRKKTYCILLADLGPLPTEYQQFFFIPAKKLNAQKNQIILELLSEKTHSEKPQKS